MTSVKEEIITKGVRTQLQDNIFDSQTLSRSLRFSDSGWENPQVTICDLPVDKSQSFVKTAVVKSPELHLVELSLSQARIKTE